MIQELIDSGARLAMDSDRSISQCRDRSWDAPGCSRKRVDRAPLRSGRTRTVSTQVAEPAEEVAEVSAESADRIGERVVDIG